MTRRALGVTAVVILLAAAPVALGMPWQSTSDTAPGATASGALSVQGATLDRSLEVTTLHLRFERADSPTERTRVAGTALDSVERRVSRLERRLASLREARANGSLGDGEFTTAVAPVVASARSLDGLLAQVRTESGDFDRETNRNVGERIEDVQSRIDRLLAVDDGAFADARLGGDFYDQVAILADAYNERVESIDMGVLGGYLNGERVNLHVKRTDGGTEVVSLRTDGDMRIRDLSAGRHSDASLRMEVDEATAREILDSDTPGAAANRAFLRGEIEVDGLGPFNAIKWTVTNLIMGLLRLFVGLIDVLTSILP